jgi:FKBP-type peptidyl-prolyl cis-trans isomerase FkpA
MNHKIGYFAFLFIISFLMIACVENEKQKPKIDVEKIKDTLVKVNHQLVGNEAEDIENYIARYHWKMEKTGTGLRYFIYKKGNGIKAEKDKYAKIKYKVNLINGEPCYSSDKEGPKEFLIGKAEVESGLEEGILLMKVGDKAKFIIPSHLAFGLLGDENKIPKRATLVYDVELIDVMK